MNRTILYYPTINIPNDEWLRNSLLYWDEVSSIIPMDWNDKPVIDLSNDIQFLIGEGQFRPIKPESLLENDQSWDSFIEFQNEFKQTVTSRRFKMLQRRLPTSRYQIHESKITNRPTIKIHANKTSFSLISFLESEGLARQNEDKWLDFDQTTGLLYMSLLAKYLADVDKHHVTISTDNPIYERMNFKKVTPEKGFPAVSLDFKNVLPTPAKNVPYEDIVAFKKLRKGELLRFRKTLSDFNVNVSKSTSNAELKDTIMDFKETLKTGVNDLQLLLKDSSIESKFKSIKSLINWQLPTTILGAGLAANSRYNLFNVSLNFATIGVGTVASIGVAAHFIEERNKNRAILRNSPFSYVHSAYEHRILEGFY